MAIELVTGHAGQGHVSSADAGRLNAGICGAGKYVLDTGLKFAYSIESANLIRIASGDAVNQGRHITIPQNTYEDANILNGTQGKTRIDVITLRYSKVTRQVDSQTVTVEEASVNVIKGTEVAAGSTPEVPAVVSGNIFDGATTDDMPLYHVLITDTSVTSVTPVFGVLPNVGNLRQSLADQQSSLTSLSGAVSNINNAVGDISDSIGSEAMGTTETTVTGAIKEHGEQLGDIEGILNNQMFKTREYSWDNVTIAADWYKMDMYNVTLSGYRAVGVIGFAVYQASSGGVYSNWCIFQRCRIILDGATDKLDYYVWNQNKSAAAKVMIKVRVLYVKSGLVS